MRKFLITITLILTTLWFVLTGFMNSVMADDKVSDYNKVVIGHVIQSTVNGNNVDHAKLLESELQKMGHQFAIQMTGILQQYLPYIMDNMMSQLRLELDKTHKCLLLKDSKIKDKDCE